jgi:hypothetical protein
MFLVLSTASERTATSKQFSDLRRQCLSHRPPPSATRADPSRYFSIFKSQEAKGQMHPASEESIFRPRRVFVLLEVTFEQTLVVSLRPVAAVRSRRSEGSGLASPLGAAPPLDVPLGGRADAFVRRRGSSFSNFRLEVVRRGCGLVNQRRSAKAGGFGDIRSAQRLATEGVTPHAAATIYALGVGVLLPHPSAQVRQEGRLKASARFRTTAPIG